METTDLLPILKNVTIFAGLDDKNIAEICEHCETVSFRAGEIIIKENTPGKDILIILKGRVRVVLDMDHDPLEIVEFGPGNCLGEVSMIGILNHSASVIAIDDTELLVVSKKLLMGILQEDKELFSILILNIARELARRLYHTDEILLQYGRKKN